MTARLAIAAAIGLVQGLGLYWLGRQFYGLSAIDSGTGLALWAVLIFGPLTLQLSLAELGRFRFWFFGVPLVAVLAGMAFYTGWSLTLIPEEFYSPDYMKWGYWFAAAFVWLVFFPWLRTNWAGDWGATYGGWYRTATTTPFLLAQSALFAGIGWLLIELAAALFDVIDIDFIERLKDESWFALPTLCVLAGIGGQALAPDVILWARRHLLTLLAWLLPFAAVLAVLFLCALAFTGLEAVWTTVSATTLMLTLQGSVILLANAAWQDGSQPQPFAAWLRRALRYSLLVLPVYAALGAYALGLRVEQYGWTVERIWGALMIGGVGMLSVGSAISVVGEAWLPRIGLINLATFAAVSLVVVLFHTPPLDPKLIAANDQVDRLLSGRVSADDFDYEYLRFWSGRPGNDALVRLAAADHADATVIRENVAAVMRKSTPWERPKTDPERLRAQLVPIPPDRTLDPSFIDAAAATFGERFDGPVCLETGQCRVLLLDLDADGREEYILEDTVHYWHVFSLREGQWTWVGRLSKDSAKYVEPEAEIIEAVRPRWNGLRIGSETYDFSPWP